MNIVNLTPHPLNLMPEGPDSLLEKVWIVNWEDVLKDFEGITTLEDFKAASKQAQE